MKINTDSATCDDLMGITIAVLIFVLQGSMVLAMSTDHLVTPKLTAVHGTVIAAHADSSGSGELT